MKKRVAAVLVLVVLAGCESTPTISAGGVQGSQDGGVIFGSGNRSDSTTTTTDATTTESGGVILGSGN